MIIRPIVLFDIDGVLADFVKGFTLAAHQMFGTPITSTANQPKWDGFPGLTQQQIDTVWKTIVEGSTFWETLQPLATKRDFETINYLTGEAQVYFTTARHGVDAHEQTRRWLREQGVRVPNVILVHKKGEIARAINANFMIDDKAGNAVYAEYHNKDRDGFQSYVIDRPYNQFDAGVIGSKVKRVKQVEEYLSDIWKLL